MITKMIMTRSQVKLSFSKCVIVFQCHSLGPEIYQNVVDGRLKVVRHDGEQEASLWRRGVRSFVEADEVNPETSELVEGADECLG